MFPVCQTNFRIINSQNDVSVLGFVQVYLKWSMCFTVKWYLGNSVLFKISVLQGAEMEELSWKSKYEMSFANNSRIVVGGRVQIKTGERAVEDQSRRGSSELEGQSPSLQLYACAANRSALWWWWWGIISFLWYFWRNSKNRFF